MVRTGFCVSGTCYLHALMLIVRNICQRSVKAVGAIMLKSVVVITHSAVIPPSVYKSSFAHSIFHSFVAGMGLMPAIH